MSLESISKNAGQLGEILERTGQPIAQAATEASHAICSEAEHLLAFASERIRQNPVPVVVGAVAFGIAIGYLIVAGRHTPTFQERYVNAPLDQAGGAFGRLYENLKFW
ncbi:MAG: hypothetical protein V4819_05235 [Verrucomicrobiota bacterium]